MKLLQDERAQAGGIILFVVGLLIVGILYVGFSMVMESIQTANNILIASPSLQYSQNHWNAVDLLYRYWWGIPIYALIIFAIYGIKNSLNKEPGEV